MADSEAAPIVVDGGSGMVKCGFAGNDGPSSVFPCLIGSPKHQNVMMGMGQQTVYVGSEAVQKRGMLTCKKPIQHGMIEDFVAVEHIYSHMFNNELRVDPDGTKVFCTEAVNNPAKNGERLGSMLMESFNVGAYYSAIQGVLALYASGRTTGSVVDMGDGVTHIVPIYEGFCVKHSVARLNLAGNDTTNYGVTVLREEGHDFSTSAERQIVDEMKKDVCEVIKDPTNPPVEERTYELPDGNIIAFTKFWHQCPECLMNPALVGMEDDGVHLQTVNSITSCDVDIRRDLYNNVILSGGTTMFKGLPERLEQDIVNAMPTKIKLSITAPPERKFSVWIGGSILSSLANFKTMWIYKDEYEESGASIFTRKSMK